MVNPGSLFVCLSQSQLATPIYICAQKRMMLGRRRDKKKTQMRSVHCRTINCDPLICGVQSNCFTGPATGAPFSGLFYLLLRLLEWVCVRNAPCCYCLTEFARSTVPGIYIAKRSAHFRQRSGVDSHRWNDDDDVNWKRNSFGEKLRNPNDASLNDAADIGEVLRPKTVFVMEIMTEPRRINLCCVLGGLVWYTGEQIIFNVFYDVAKIRRIHVWTLNIDVEMGDGDSESNGEGTWFLGHFEWKSNCDQGRRYKVK